MIHLEVAGRPMPRGSMRAFLHRMTGRPVITDVRRAPLRAWMQEIRESARHVAPDDAPWDGPVGLDITFRMPIPKRGIIAGTYFHEKRPDVDKLLRAVLDALTGIYYVDDSQVSSLSARKTYDSIPGVVINATLLKGHTWS